MTTRTVSILLVMAIVSVAFAGYGLSTRASYQDTDFSGQRVFPDLINQAKDATEVTLVQHGRTMTFDLKDGQWTHRESDGYPIHNNLISKAIFSLSNMEYLDAKTNRPERHGELDLRDPKKVESKSQRLTVAAGSTVLGDLIIGRANYFLPETTTGGMYVRNPGDDQTWLVRGLIDLGTEPRNFLQREIIDIALDRIATVKVTQPNGSVLLVEPKDGVTGSFAFTNLPVGTKLTSEFAPRNLAALVNSFVLNGAKRVENVDLDPNAAYVGEFETIDGIAVQLRMWATDDLNYMTLDISYTGNVPNSNEAKYVAEVAERTRGWAYIIPEYQFDQISKKWPEITGPVDGS